MYSGITVNPSSLFVAENHRNEGMESFVINFLSTTFTKRDMNVSMWTSLFLSFFLSLLLLKTIQLLYLISSPAVEKTSRYATEHLKYIRQWKNKSWEWVKRERGQCKGDEKRRREKEQGETESQRQEGQAKRWNEWCEMCPMWSLWWTITAWGTAHAAGTFSTESKNQCYRCCFHTSNSVLTTQWQKTTSLSLIVRLMLKCIIFYSQAGFRCIKTIFCKLYFTSHGLKKYTTTKRLGTLSFRHEL